MTNWLPWGRQRSRGSPAATGDRPWLTAPFTPIVVAEDQDASEPAADGGPSGKTAACDLKASPPTSSGDSRRSAYALFGVAWSRVVGVIPRRASSSRRGGSRVKPIFMSEPGRAKQVSPADIRQTSLPPMPIHAGTSSQTSEAQAGPMSEAETWLPSHIRIRQMSAPLSELWSSAGETSPTTPLSVRRPWAAGQADRRFFRTTSTGSALNNGIQGNHGTQGNRGGWRRATSTGSALNSGIPEHGTAFHRATSFGSALNNGIPQHGTAFRRATSSGSSYSTAPSRHASRSNPSSQGFFAPSKPPGPPRRFVTNKTMTIDQLFDEVLSKLNDEAVAA